MKKRSYPAVLLLWILLLTGCSSVRIEEGKSPSLTGMSVDTHNEMSEDRQYVQVLLQFDRSISLQEDAASSLRILIGGNRVSESRIQMSRTQEDQIELLIQVTAVTSGILEIGPAAGEEGITGILDAGGSYSCLAFQAEALIPSGIGLTALESKADTQSVWQVEGQWNIRSITWLQLSEQGIPVTSNVEQNGERLENAVAIHGHDFLLSDATMAAEEIAEALNRHFGGRYTFRAEGSRVLAEAVSGGPCDLELTVYLYQTIS